MSPWTALLESLHSALIDELTERHPEPKPTLGMPLRQRALEAPSGATQILFCEASFQAEALGASRGSAMLAFEPMFMKAIGLSAEAFWSALLKRAGAEFARRGISPRLTPPVIQNPPIRLPSGYSDPQRVVWIPFQIPSGSCYLGLAV